MIEKRIQLSADQANRLDQLTQATRVTEDQVVAKALDILFTLTDILDARVERRAWSLLSEDALRRVWDTTGMPRTTTGGSSMALQRGDLE